MTDWLGEPMGERGSSTFIQTSTRAWSFDEVYSLVAEETARLGDRSGTQVVVCPRLDVASIVSLLAIPGSGATMVVVGPDRPDGDKLVASAAMDTRQSHSIIFTSGSSGEPKGVRLSTTNWEAAARASITHLGHGADDRWLCALPLHHVGGLSIIYRSIFAGGTVVLEADQRRIGAWLDRVSWASLVATQLTRILQQRTDVLHNTPRVLLGGGAVDPNLVTKAIEAGVAVFPTYGMTETTAQAATAREPGGPLLPLPGVEFVEDQGRLRISGPTVMLGYAGEPEVEGTFLTNDRGSVEGGKVKVVGRADRVIITGGENVDPASVERALISHPDVIEAAVFGAPDIEWGERVVGAYAGTAGEEELRTIVASLPVHCRPKQWLRVDSLPRTELGKIDYALLIRLVTGVDHL